MGIFKSKKQQEEHFNDAFLRLAHEVLSQYKSASEDQNEIAEALLCRFSEEYGGSSVYVPTGRVWRLQERYAGIYARFNGKNYNHLRHETGYTNTHLRRIISEFKRREFQKRQQKLDF